MAEPISHGGETAARPDPAHFDRRPTPSPAAAPRLVSPPGPSQARRDLPSPVPRSLPGLHLSRPDEAVRRLPRSLGPLRFDWHVAGDQPVPAPYPAPGLPAPAKPDREGRVWSVRGLGRLSHEARLRALRLLRPLTPGDNPVAGWSDHALLLAAHLASSSAAVSAWEDGRRITGFAPFHDVA